MNLETTPHLIYSILRQPKIHGVNPNLIYKRTGKKFDLPRFFSDEMKEARLMNKIAKNDEYIKLSTQTPTNATPKDLERITSDKFTFSIKRAIWINPKDSKGYYLLEEGRDKNENINIRILNSLGEFVKNATIKPKEVILTDLEKGLEQTREIGNLEINHSDFIHIIANRYNPFAKYKFLHIQDEQNIPELQKHITPNTSCISASYGSYHDIPEYPMSGLEIKEDLYQYIPPNELKLLEQLKPLAKKTRVFASAGNRGKSEVAGFLLDTGFEGVGGLNSKGFVHENSASRNSLFTQHYEQYKFPIRKTSTGINITGLRGTDLPIKLPETIKNNQIIDYISGTSYSTPIRAAKTTLNEMMKGIL